MIMAAKAPELVEKLVVWGANAYITKADMETFESKTLSSQSSLDYYTICN